MTATELELLKMALDMVVQHQTAEVMLAILKIVRVEIKTRKVLSSTSGPSKINLLDEITVGWKRMKLNTIGQKTKIMLRFSRHHVSVVVALMHRLLLFRMKKTIAT